MFELFYWIQREFSVCLGFIASLGLRYSHLSGVGNDSCLYAILVIPRIARRCFILVYSAAVLILYMKLAVVEDRRLHVSSFWPSGYI